jgi:hypothetical protein
LLIVERSRFGLLFFSVMMMMNMFYMSFLIQIYITLQGYLSALINLSFLNLMMVRPVFVLFSTGNLSVFVVPLNGII